MDILDSRYSRKTRKHNRLRCFLVKTKNRLRCFLVFLEYRESKMSIFGICFILYFFNYISVLFEVSSNSSGLEKPSSSLWFPGAFFLCLTSSGQQCWAPQSLSPPQYSAQLPSSIDSGRSSLNSGWMVVEWMPSLWKKSFTLFAIGM